MLPRYPQKLRYHVVGIGLVGDGGAMIFPHWEGPGNTSIGDTGFMDYLQGTNGWVYYEGKVTAPQGATNCTLCCLMAACSGIAWFDDIVFQEIPDGAQ